MTCEICKDTETGLDPDRIPAGLTDSTAMADVRWPYGWNETKQDRPIHNGPES